jgi:DNA-binding response OmpR family regulator
MNNSEDATVRMKVLVVDDDQKLCRLIRDYLSPLGYDVEAAHNGLKGLEMAKTGNFQAMILDVMLPAMDGMEVLKSLRKTSDMPVLMLTARGEETDRIVGLELGADDYLPKTFSTRELLARLRAVTRRCYLPVKSTETSSNDGAIRAGSLFISPSSRSVRMNHEEVSLTAIEFDILICLAKAPEKVLTRDQLLDAVAGRSYEVYDRSIDVHISSIRKKLHDNGRVPHIIKTVRSAGYLFCSPTGHKQ